MKLEEITSGGSIAGIEPSVIVTVVALVPISPDAVQLIYKTPDGTLRDRLLGRTDEDTISVATQERPWSFDGDGDAFKLAVEDHCRIVEHSKLKMAVRSKDLPLPIGAQGMGGS
jgi:hypothetical protein